MSESIDLRQNLDLAVKAFVAGQIDQAELTCLAILRECPNSSETHYLLAEIYQAGSQLSESLNHFYLAIRHSKTGLTKLQNRIKYRVVDKVGVDREFDPVEPSRLKRLIDCNEPEINQVERQRANWAGALLQEDWDSEKPFGYSYGDPEDPKHMYGNYLGIKNQLRSFAGPEKVVLEIGTLAGKWVQYFLDSKKFICVDITDVGFEYLKKRFNDPKNLEYYLTEGDELRGVNDNSVDLVYSMDSLVRAPKHCIRSYLQEVCRVLRPGGYFLMHLPCVEIEGSNNAGFTKLTVEEIKNFVLENTFNQISISGQIVTHGVIVDGFKISI